jgi:hypothetical protein
MSAPDDDLEGLPPADELEARLTMSLLDLLVNGKPEPTLAEIINERMKQAEAATLKYLSSNLWRTGDELPK